MTQPQEAVGGASDTVVAAEPTVADRFAAISEEIQAEEPKKPEEEQGAEAPEGAEEAHELTEEDVAEEEAEPEEAAPIPPPASWTAEEKEAFAGLPPALQATVARRETEREAFLQTKAQEAKATRATVEAEAMQYVQQRETAHVQALNALMVQVPERPSHLLQADDPYRYAELMDAHEAAVAHNGFIEQQVHATRQQAAQAQQVIQAREAMETRAVLQEKYPEFLDPTTGPKLQAEAKSIGRELGFSDEQMANLNATDILAIRQASDWRAKAQKYDTLMAKKMERVREAKGLPRVSKPGAAQPKGAAEAGRYNADRELMKQGNRDAERRVFERFI